MTLILTRLLYPKDEVIISLVNELLLKQNLDICYYWTSEVYYSDKNIFWFIWKIYFDFYAEYNPKLEIYIKKKQVLYDTSQELLCLFDIINNLFSCKISSTEFLLRQYSLITKKPLIIYRHSSHKKWNWLQEYENKYHTLLKSLHKDNLITAVVQLQNILLHTDAKEVYHVIVSYYSKYIVLVALDKIEKKWNTRGWYDDFHGLLSLIVHLHTDMNNINKRHIIKKTDKKIIKHYIDIDNAIHMRHKTKDRVYKILSDFREYPLHEACSAFKLTKDIDTSFKKNNLLYWEYFAYKSPLWKERIQEYRGVPCEKTKNIVFKNTNDADDFYELYNMEFDEQSKIVQDLSLLLRKNVIWNTWYNNIFVDDPIIKFGDHFKFEY